MTKLEVRQPTAAKPRFFYGYVVVFSLLIMMIVIWGTRFAFGVFFNPMLTEFGWTRAMVSGAFSLSMIVDGITAVLMGRLNARLGPRIVLTLTGILLGIGYLLMSQISSFWQFYLFYGVLIGIGMSGSFVPVTSTVARWFVARRSTMTGIVLAGTGIGNLIGAPVSEWLISSYDWRTSYIISGAVVLVVSVVFAQFLRRDPTQMGQVPYGESRDAKVGVKPEVWGFSLQEALHTRQFWLFSGMLLCFGACMFTIMVHIVLLATGLGISAATAASILATIGALSIGGRLILGGVADRIGNKQIFIIGFSFMAASLFWLAPAREAWMLYLFAIIFGFTQGGMGVSESPLVAKLFGLSSHGLIFGVAGLGFTFGAAIGPLLAGYIFDVTGSYQLAFIIAGISGTIALVLTIALRPMRHEAEQAG